MVFVLIFIIYYLFIQSDVNKSRWKRPPVFIYLWKSLVVRYGFRLNIQYLFIYLFKAISTKAGGTDHLYLLTPITFCETWFSFEYSVTIYLFIQNDVNKSRGVLVSVKFGCFSPSRFSHFHCNTIRKAIKAHENLHTN